MELSRLAAEDAAFLFNVSLRSLLLFSAAGLVLLFLRRASAADRHLLWTMTAGSLLLLPVLCACLPRWDAPVLSSRTTASLRTPSSLRAAAGVHRLPSALLQKPLLTLPDDARGSIPSVALGNSPNAPEKAAAELQATSMPHRLASQASIPVAEPLVSRPAPLHSQSFGPAQSASSPIPGTSAAEWLVGLWLVGVLIALCRTTFSLLAARRLLRGSRLVTEGALVEAAMEASSRLSLSTPMIIKTGTAAKPVAVPMTFGIVHPVVLMPMEAASWPAERLRVVLLHEAAHVKRLDWMTTMLTQVVCALYWFHPLVWLTLRRLRAESEQACDDLVLSSGVEAVEYADHLMEVVRGLAGRRVSSAVVTMAYSQEIAGRLKTILETSKNRSAATLRGLAVAMFTSLAIIVPMATFHPVAFAQAKVRAQAKEVDKEQVQKIQPFTGISTLTAGKPQWDQRLADGTRVRLMSVGAQDVRYRIASYWTPDGLVNQKGDVDTHPSLVYGMRGYQFFYEITFASAERQNTAALTYSQAGEQGSVGGGVTPWHNGEADYDRSPGLFPENQTKGTVFVHVATGPQRTLITASPLTGATRHLPTSETVKVTKAVIKLFREQHHLTQTTEIAVTLPIRYVQDMSEYSFYPMDWNGKRINVQHAGSNIPDITKKMAHMAFDFRTSELPISRVKEFRFEYRPSETATFHDVALQPDVSVTSAAVHSAAPSQSALLPNGTQVRLVQITPVHAENRINPYGPAWTPEGSPSEFRGVSPGEGFVNSPIEMLPGRNRSETYGYGRLDMVTMPRRNFDAGQSSFVPHGSGHADITVPLATGPYATVISGPLNRDTRLMLGQGETAILSKVVVRPPANNLVGKRLGPVAEVDLTLPDRFLRGGYFLGYRLDALGADGKSIPVLGFSGPTVVYHGHGMTRVAFDTRTAELSRLKVAGFRFGYRAIHPVIFSNVALQPSVPTASKSPSAASTFPPASTQKDKSKRVASISNLHEIGLALMKYVADHHYRFPDAAHWMDQIIPYLVPSTMTGAARQQRIAAVFHDPASPPSQLWSYSFNRALSGLSLGQIDNPNMIVAVFESSQGVRNASDGGQSLPQPGRHFGGSDFLFVDGHTKWLRAEDTPTLVAKLNPPVIDSSGNLAYSPQPQDTTGWFAPVNPDARQKIPIQGQAYDRRTMKPLSSTFVIFSQSPKKITVGSVWPSSFTDKAGRFQSILYPGKNYLMVLENNRFRLVGRTLWYKANGNTGSVSTQGTKGGPLRSAQSDYTIHLSLPGVYALKMSSTLNNASAQEIVTFVPVARSASR